MSLQNVERLAHCRQAGHRCLTSAAPQAGLSPTYTLTEDFALGMAMKKKGWQCRYVQEYCALGEAPEQVRNCYQQRSRWCKVCLTPT